MDYLFEGEEIFIDLREVVAIQITKYKITLKNGVVLEECLWGDMRKIQERLIEIKNTP